MEEKFNELKRRIATTANNRFNASARLNLHNQWSLCTVISFSLGLILVSIAQVSNLTVAFSSAAINAFSIFFSVVILVFSTVLSMSNFVSRADKFLDCGRELHALSLQLVKILYNHSLQTDETYDKHQTEYANILSRYENHQKIDHLFTKLAWSDQYSPVWYRWTITYGRYAAHFSIYVFLIATEIGWLVALFFPSIYSCKP